jgi:hypothetical protein
MNAVPKCTSWLGHKFEGRYSYTNPALVTLMNRASEINNLPPSMVVNMRDATYHCDVCVRCGHVIEPHVEITNSAEGK